MYIKLIKLEMLVFKEEKSSSNKENSIQLLWSLKFHVKASPLLTERFPYLFS